MRGAGWPIALRLVNRSHGMENIMERLSITLTGDKARRIEGAAALGRYAQVSEAGH